MFSYKIPETEIDFANYKNMFEKNSSNSLAKKGHFNQDSYTSGGRKSIYCFGSLFSFFSFFFVFPFPVYENVRVSLIKRRTAVPIDGLVGIEVACDILNK